MKSIGSFVLAFGCVAGLVLQSGCGQQAHINELSKKPWVAETAHWPELDDLMSNSKEPDSPSVSRMLRAAYGAGGDPMGPPPLCRMINDQRFQDNIKKFDETPIPSKFVTPVREADKKELLAVFAELKDSCAKKAAPTALMPIFKKIETLMVKMSEIPGQTPPQGADAAKYAPTK